MSYEKLGLGWSDMPQTEGTWPFQRTTFPTCEQVTGRGIKKCFTSTPDDIRCAQYSGCQNLHETCRTVSGTQGTAWCCPHDRPPPPHVAPCIPSGVQPGAIAQTLVCRRQHVPFGTLRDARSRSIWTVQNKLCQLGIDPGPVDGTENNIAYRPAIRAFQARNNLPQTGEPDATTLRAMGLTNAQALANAIAGRELPPGVGTGLPSMLPYMLLGGFGLSGVFLFYALKKYKRSRR